MKIRFPIWLTCMLIAMFAFPAGTAFAQARRGDAPKTRPEKRPETRPTATPPKAGLTDREKERLREAEETRRQKERAGNPQPRRPVVILRDDRHRHNLNEALLRRERILRERRAEERRDHARWIRLRNERAAARRREIYHRWGLAVSTPAGRAEFELFAKRKARLNRIRDIGAERNDQAMIKRTDFVISLENSRHANVVAVLLSGQR